ncbi:MAG: sugar transferase, partial [Patescibacteria group bacterium]
RAHKALDRTDKYLRKPDTRLAQVLHKISPKKNSEFMHSRANRRLDVAISAPAAIVAAPVVAGLAVAKILEDGGSPFYIDPRHGTGPGDEVNIWKLRSMIEGAHLNGGENVRISNGLKPEDHPRNTKLGKFMRKFDLDELPQLFQVLFGYLSLFGNRHLNKHTMALLKEEWSPERFQRSQERDLTDKKGIINLHTIIAKTRNERGKYHAQRFYHENASLSLNLYMLWRLMRKNVEKGLKYLDSSEGASSPFGQPKKGVASGSEDFEELLQVAHRH